MTEANLRYTGSLTLDPELMRAADLVPYEQVQVVNINNGARFETYCIEGAPASGIVCLNGAAARLAVVGDKIIVISYAHMTEVEIREQAPRLVFVDEQNHELPSGSPAAALGAMASRARREARDVLGGVRKQRATPRGDASPPSPPETRRKVAAAAGPQRRHSSSSYRQ